MIEFTHWPEDLARRYRDAGYWLGQPLTRGLDQQAATRPDAVALISDGRHISYAQFDWQARNLAAYLTAQGLGRGDTALVQLPNLAEFYICFMALLKIGVAPVNALFSHRQLELRAYAQQIKPKLLIAARSHELFQDDAFLQELRQDQPQLTEVLFLGGAGVSDLAAHLAQDRDLPEGAEPTAADQVAFFQLSGGSTGTPKLIPRTHNDYDYSIRLSAEICALTPHTRFLCALPAGHNFALSSPGALGVFHAGGTVILASSPEPQLCFDLIARHGVNMAALVPPAVALWLRLAEAEPDRARRDLASLDLLQVGGANFAEATARQVGPVLGCALQQVFGMAEGLVNYTRLDDPDEVITTTQGRPMSPADELRILDEDGQPVPKGQPGMLATRGPYTFRGYYQSPDHNRTAFDAEGFYHSGDLVQQVGDNLRVVGRVKDQINRGGEKIAAEEVENLLLRHPDLTHAALVAYQDAHLGEKSCAFLVLRADATRPTPPALRRYLLELGVAEFKLPDRFRYLEQLPLTPVGKIDKRRLRAELAA